jgi:hypothetical protein
MASEITTDAFEIFNRNEPEWFSFLVKVPNGELNSISNLLEYGWCAENCDSPWFSMVADGKVFFYFRDVVDAIPFRLRQKTVKYLGHNRSADIAHAA